MRILCTCGCGLQVTHATKINHLNGRGKTSLRARVLQENESLKPSTRQQPVLLRDHQKKKRSHPSSNQTGNHKRLKVAQLDVDQIPGTSLRKDAESLSSLVPNKESEIFPAQAYTDPTESHPSPVQNQVSEFHIQMHTDPTESPCSPVSLALELNSGIEDGSADTLSFARRSNRISERTRDVAEQRWGNGHLRHEILRSNGGGGYRSEDEEDVDLNMTGNEDSDDEDDDEDKEGEDDDDLFAESDVTGISAWDLLGEGFEREVASIGMSLARESFVLLTII
jgi:hypothetical protein